MAEPDGFAQFVSARSPALLRSAWLLTGNRAGAEDLVQTALAHTWARWSRVERQDDPTAHVRRVLMTTFLSWRRRRSWSEVPLADVPDSPSAVEETATSELRDSVSAALRSLPRGQRAVVVLRYFDDLTEAQTAAALGCSVGTVKSQASRALARLRIHPAMTGVWDEEVTP